MGSYSCFTWSMLTHCNLIFPYNLRVKNRLIALITFLLIGQPMFPICHLWWNAAVIISIQCLQHTANNLLITTLALKIFTKTWRFVSSTPSLTGLWVKNVLITFPEYSSLCYLSIYCPLHGLPFHFLFTTLLITFLAFYIELVYSIFLPTYKIPLIALLYYFTII